jgi:CRISPR-associated protein Csm3
MAKLSDKIVVKGKITLLSGLHIGGNNMGMEVGGVNATVIRNPVTGEPYIPGSSLKGKIRSLLEQKAGIFDFMTNQVTHGAAQNGKHSIVKMFGNAKSDDENIPSKIIVRDCRLHGVDKLNKVKTFDLPFTEVKTEVVIDRIRAVATPRQLERVPAGVEFNMEIVLNVWEETKKEPETADENTGAEPVFTNDVKHKLTAQEMLQLLCEGFDLLEKDFLGGKGSRGSGQVKIGIESISGTREIPKGFEHLTYNHTYAASIYGYPA